MLTQLYRDQQLICQVLLLENHYRHRLLHQDLPTVGESQNKYARERNHSVEQDGAAKPVRQ